MKIVIFCNVNGIAAITTLLAKKLTGFCESSNDIAVFNSLGQHLLIDLSQSETTSISDATVILINDVIKIPETREGVIIDITSFVNEDDVYVIYHDNERVNYIEKHKAGIDKMFKDKIKSEITGSHTTDSPMFKVFQVLQDWNKADFEKLITVFPSVILEAKLNLLHYCSSPSGAKEVLKSIADNEKKFTDAFNDQNVNLKSAKEIIMELSRSTDENDSTKPEYIEKLKELRKLVMGS